MDAFLFQIATKFCCFLENVNKIFFMLVDSIYKKIGCKLT